MEGPSKFHLSCSCLSLFLCVFGCMGNEETKSRVKGGSQYILRGGKLRRWDPFSHNPFLANDLVLERIFDFQLFSGKKTQMRASRNYVSALRNPRMASSWFLTYFFHAFLKIYLYSNLISFFFLETIIF